jgi:hypothetical protein
LKDLIILETCISAMLIASSSIIVSGMSSKCQVEAKQFELNSCSCISILVYERIICINVKPVCSGYSIWIVFQHCWFYYCLICHFFGTSWRRKTTRNQNFIHSITFCITPNTNHWCYGLNNWGIESQ